MPRATLYRDAIGTHHNDITLMLPVFHHAKLVAMAIATLLADRDRAELRGFVNGLYRRMSKSEHRTHHHFSCSQFGKQFVSMTGIQKTENFMEALCIKVAVIIALTHGIRMVSCAAGPRWSGLILGLPASTAIVLFFYAQDHGIDFAGRSAESALVGLVSAIVFAALVGKALHRGRSLIYSLLLGGLAFMAVACPLRHCTGECLELRLLLALAFIFISHRWITANIPACDQKAQSHRKRGWATILAIRTAIPVFCLMTVLTAASRLDAEWAGLIGTFPCTLVALLVVTYLEVGPSTTAQIARSFPLGNLSMVAFLLTFRLACPDWGLAAAMGLGYLASLHTLLGIAIVRRYWRQVSIAKTVSAPLAPGR